MPITVPECLGQKERHTDLPLRGLVKGWSDGEALTSQLLRGSGVALKEDGKHLSKYCMAQFNEGPLNGMKRLGPDGEGGEIAYACSNVKQNSPDSRDVSGGHWVCLT